MWVGRAWLALVAALVALAGSAAERGSQLECGARPRCRRVDGGGLSAKEREFEVQGTNIVIRYSDGENLKLNCKKSKVLDSPALPHFESVLRVSSVTLEWCPPPAGSGSFASTLAALNVTLLLTNTLGNLALNFLPPEPPLTASHFTGLERLVGLTLTATRSSQPRPTPAHGFLSNLRSLLFLEIQNIQLPHGKLDMPVSSLQQLTLTNTGLQELPEQLPILSDLWKLGLNEKLLAKVVVPKELLTLYINLKNTTLVMNETSALVNVTLDKWMTKQPEPLQKCDALQILELLAPAAESLPARWLANCLKLKTLVVKYAHFLKTLPSELLNNATVLTSFTLLKSGLEALPENMFHGAPNLREINLSQNHLKLLPSGSFSGPRALASLDLSSNELDGAALGALAALRELRELNLAHNSRIENVCESGQSPILNLTKLTSLSLRNTNVTRICRDWREKLTLLKVLDLQFTRISILGYDDLQYKRERNVSESEVLLDGAPITVVEFTYKEYENSLSAVASGARVQINSLLACDCRMYWTRLALERARHTVRATLACGPLGRLLDKETPESLECPAEEECLRAALHPACECRQRPAAADRWMVRARCDRLGLRDVPRLPAGGPRLYRLQLPNNNISRLRAADLPHNLQELDLSNNFVTAIEEETVEALETHPQQVLLHLGGNPLACDCRAAPLLRVVQRGGESLRALACRNGTAVRALALAHCGARSPPAAWAAAALLAALALAASIAAYFSPPERRMFLKVVLHRWGVLRRAPSPLDRGLRFDAFVSFAHEDEDVVRELVRRLEGGPAPYRLCLHYRDWVPGRLIPDQIQESVRQSRRTLALVSRHFLRSTWACAEFREAHAHALRDVTPRLVVVLLEEPARLPLDAALRRYLACNTYVRWGDPWFWDKLALALPPPAPALRHTSQSTPTVP